MSRDAFQKWFSDSAVVDTQGQPLIVYHGTTAPPFEAFRPHVRRDEQLGFGIHFTEDDTFAMRYANNPEVARRGKHPRVIAAYLSVQKPLFADKIVMSGSPEFALAQALAGRRLRTETHPDGRKMAYLQGAIDATSPSRAERLIRAAGYDGICYRAQIGEVTPYGKWSRGPESRSWVVFEPHQVKTVDNVGTWSPADPRMRHNGPPDVQRTTWYHLTDKARFQLDSRFAPADNTVAMEDRSGRPGIYLAPDVEKWVNGHGYWRPFVVEVTVDPEVFSHPGVSGRWGGELFIPASLFGYARVSRVIPLDAYAREHFGAHGWVEGWVGREFDTNNVIPSRGSPGFSQYPFRGYKYLGPDVREMPLPEVQRLKRDLHTFRRAQSRENPTALPSPMYPSGWQVPSDAAAAWLAAQTTGDTIFRGMTSDEYDATVGSQQAVWSTGRYSLSGEGTCFSFSAEDALSYAAFGCDDPRKTGRPVYVVEVDRPATARVDRDGYVKADAPVPFSSVRRVLAFSAGPQDTIVARELGLPQERSNPPPPSSGVFYHGTSTRAAAEGILAHGICPGSVVQGRHHTAPIAGRVYLTPTLSYAVIYALGGDVAGHQNTMRGQQAERYGFVFVAPAGALSDIQPDEDFVGELAQMSFQSPEHVQRYYPRFAGKVPVWMRSLAQSNLTPRQLMYVKGGEYIWLAAAGKKLLKVMTDRQKQEVIDLGASVASRGVVIPSECWRIEKSRSSELARDGSNFFDVAERILP